MTMIQLQSTLGNRMMVTLKDDLTPEERQIENEQTALVIGLAKQMIQNGDLILRTEKLMSQNRSLKNSYAMKLIEGDEKAGI